MMERISAWKPASADRHEKHTRQLIPTNTAAIKINKKFTSACVFYMCSYFEPWGLSRHVPPPLPPFWCQKSTEFAPLTSGSELRDTFHYHHPLEHNGVGAPDVSVGDREAWQAPVFRLYVWKMPSLWLVLENTDIFGVCWVFACGPHSCRVRIVTRVRVGWLAG